MKSPLNASARAFCGSSATAAIASEAQDISSLPRLRGTRYGTVGSSVAPWPQPTGKREEEARVGPLVVDPDAGQRNGERGVEREAVEIDARAGADRIEMLGAGGRRSAVAVADLAWSQKP